MSTSSQAEACRYTRMQLCGDALDAVFVLFYDMR
jgi:hypothetical protein